MILIQADSVSACAWPYMASGNYYYYCVYKPVCHA